MCVLIFNSSEGTAEWRTKGVFAALAGLLIVAGELHKGSYVGKSSAPPPRPLPLPHYLHVRPALHKRKLSTHFLVGFSAIDSVFHSRLELIF